MYSIEKTDVFDNGFGNLRITEQKLKYSLGFRGLKNMEILEIAILLGKALVNFESITLQDTESI